jgi:hypothetical protein
VLEQSAEQHIESAGGEANRQFAWSEYRIVLTFVEAAMPTPWAQS